MDDTSDDEKAQDFAILLDDPINSPSIYLDQFIDLGKSYRLNLMNSLINFA